MFKYLMSYVIEIIHVIMLLPKEQTVPTPPTCVSKVLITIFTKCLFITMKRYFQFIYVSENTL